MTVKKWVRYAWKGGSKAKADEGKPQPGNGVENYGDKENMERHQHGPDPVGAGKVIKTN